MNTENAALRNKIREHRKYLKENINMYKGMIKEYDRRPSDLEYQKNALLVFKAIEKEFNKGLRS